MRLGTVPFCTFYGLYGVLKCSSNKTLISFTPHFFSARRDALTSPLRGRRAKPLPSEATERNTPLRHGFLREPPQLEVAICDFKSVSISFSTIFAVAICDRRYKRGQSPFVLFLKSDAKQYLCVMILLVSLVHLYQAMLYVYFQAFHRQSYKWQHP